MLSGPTQASVSDAAYSVVFVVDTSGSMCCTVPVQVTTIVASPPLCVWTLMLFSFARGG